MPIMPQILWVHHTIVGPAVILQGQGQLESITKGIFEARDAVSQKSFPAFEFIVFFISKNLF